MFGIGCEIVGLDEPHLKERLLAAVNRAWESADDLRPKLLRVANEQIHIGRKAYRRLSELVCRSAEPKTASA
jgi:hypothetical protein